MNHAFVAQVTGKLCHEALVTLTTALIALRRIVLDNGLRDMLPRERDLKLRAAIKMIVSHKF